MANRFELWLSTICVAAMLLPAVAGANSTAGVSMVGTGAPARVDSSKLEGNGEVGQEAQSKSEQRAKAVPEWLPRRTGTRAARVGGATRGTRQDLTVYALVPQYDDAALTIAAQPTLYWHVSEATSYSVNFTLIDPNAIDPLVDVTLPGPFEPGVHALDLSAHPVELAPGKQYQWFVAVMPDPEQRSSDIIARGAIERVDAEPALRTALATAAPGERANALAKNGIWYDALEALQADVENHPSATEPRIRRAVLLEQVGLTTLAAVD